MRNADWGAGSNVANDMSDAAEARAKEMVDEVYKEMDAFLIAFRCDPNCEIGLISIQPPDMSSSATAEMGKGRNRLNVVGYTLKASSVGWITLDCHKPIPGQHGHKPGTGLSQLRPKTGGKKGKIQIG